LVQIVSLRTNDPLPCSDLIRLDVVLSAPDIYILRAAADDEDVGNGRLFGLRGGAESGAT
jgi:hypothetical protein